MEMIIAILCVVVVIVVVAAGIVICKSALPIYDMGLGSMYV